MSMIEPTDKIKDELKEGITVLPSLHYIVFGTEDTEQDHVKPGGSISVKEKLKEDKKKLFSEEQLTKYLRPKTEPPCVIMIEGPRGTFKATLARDFLINGLINGESVLFIRLKDNVTFHPKNNPFKVSVECLKKIISSKRLAENSLKKEIENNQEDNSNTTKIDNGKVENKEIEITETDIDYFWKCFSETSGDESILVSDEKYKKYKSNTKREISKWEYKDNATLTNTKSEQHKKTLFIEIAFKSGYILAEEFIKILLEVLMEHDNIKRIVIDDLSKIGVSYPFLYSSKTAGELFITALVHIVRNQHLSLVMTGTTGEYDKSNRMVERAKTLADTVLTHNHCNVFGDKYSTIMGDGLAHHVGDQGIVGDIVPAVIRPLKLNMFKIDTEILKGLVGFDTGDIHRPGLTLYVFEDTAIQESYNLEIATLLKSAFAYECPTLVNLDSNKAVDVIPFAPKESPAIHDGLGLLQGNPLAKTVLCTVDEFYTEELEKVFIPIQELLEKNEKTFAGYNIKKLKKIENVKELHILPFYKNVLLMAYKKREFPDGFGGSWFNILEKLGNPEKKFNNLVDFKVGPDETLACMLIDAIISGHYKKKVNIDQGNNSIESESFQSIEEILNNIKSSDKLAEISNELFALRKLLRYSPKSKRWIENAIVGYPKNLKERAESNYLCNNAKIYLCWYTELREMLYLNPKLASELTVSRLPGGGFKGDWHIGVLKGSVNYSLGKRVLNKLCSEQEDRKRFIEGVGLPSHPQFSKLSFNMWSNAPDNLETVYEIYNGANERKKIINYQQFRMLLSALCIELIQIEANSDEKIKDKIEKNIIYRLSEIIKKD